MEMIHIFKKVTGLSPVQSQPYTKTTAVALCCPLHCLEQRSCLSEVLVFTVFLSCLGLVGWCLGSAETWWRPLGHCSCTPSAAAVKNWKGMWLLYSLSRNPGHCHVFCRLLSCGQGPTLWYICATWKATDWQIKDTFGGGGYELWQQIVAVAWVIWVPYSDEVHWSQTTGKSPSSGLPPLLRR